MEPLAFSNEEGHAKIVFQLPDTGRDIGLNAVQPLGRAGHTAFANNGRNAKRRGIEAFFSEYKFQICSVIRERIWTAKTTAGA